LVVFEKIMIQSRKNLLFIILSGVFITNAIIAELIGGKLIDVGKAVMSIGILPWPIVFITTDLINEYFGEKGVRKLSFITAGLIAYTFLVLFVAIRIPSTAVSSVSTDQFKAVFGQSQLIIVGSIIAFLVSQLIDVSIFNFLKKKTGTKMIWLRSTGSTVVSQLFDSFIVLGIAFWLPGVMDTPTFILSAFTGYFVKLIIAVGMTPIIYLGHYTIDIYLTNDRK
jgi:queuosine precursor transporter